MVESRLLAIVPARGGSKRLPRKNVLLLGGKPLIGWTIDAARQSGCFVDVLVSTDDAEIAAAARAHGALVPWLRPAALATDAARSIDVVLHAMDCYESAHGPVAGVVLLQPTSPFRSVATIRQAVGRFVELGSETPLVGVSPAEKHPAWSFTLEGSRMHPFGGWEMLKRPAQELPPAYSVNGAMYITTPARLRDTQNFYTEDMQAFVMHDPAESLDIDTAADWERAENYARLRDEP